MLLGRTASGLYWMHRYIERAENMARIVDAGLRLALTKPLDAPEEWASVVISAGMQEGFRSKYGVCSARTVSDYLLRDCNNPSSVLSCVEAARSNARTVRTALTREAWESVNEVWIAVKRVLSHPVPESDLPAVLNHIKREAALICGTFHGTMLRNDILDFARLGTFIERADNTARILGVKYHVLLPSVSYVGSTLDNHQWESILRSVAAHRSYRWIYDVQHKPGHIADYLILNGRMPRSLHFCYRSIADDLEDLAEEYGITHACHETAGKTLATLKENTVGQIFDHGLHEFLIDFIARNNRLGIEVANSYNFA